MRRLIHETSAKVEAVGEILARHPASKVLIFTEYTSLARAVSERYLIPLVTHDISPQEREQVMAMCIQNPRVYNLTASLPTTAP